MPAKRKTNRAAAGDALAAFHAPVRAWFEATLGEPTRAQALAWPHIQAGESTLLLAPTGSGKTLAAFLSALERCMYAAPPANANAKKRPGTRVLYVSPLKALAVDVEKNLRAPLAGILEHGARAGDGRLRAPTVQVRTGDTPTNERAKMVRRPPDILITTPESLYLILTSNARSMLEQVETVIVDEIHSLVATKRGVHLFLSLERLEAIRRSEKPLQRIGLSATQRPLDEVARLLGGLERGGGKPRPVTIVDAGEKKRLELTVEVPGADADLEDAPDEAPGGARRSIWPEVHERLVALIGQHATTMVFVNSRRLAERLAAALNDVAGREIALAHHGSVAREKRADIEDRLKRGDLPAIVATSSLELGIDMGAVDLVVQIEAPPTIASGLQRVGRAGHTVVGTSKGVLVPKHRADLLACAAASACMRAGEVEETFYPRSPLDVLAQQIVATAAVGPIGVDALYDLVRRAAPYAELPRTAFEGVLDMLSGRYPSDAFAELRPRLVWDRVGGTVRAREGAARLAIANGGTIPDRGLYGVFLNGGGGAGAGAGRSAADDKRRSRRVGELDEEMVFELREGEVFLLGASSWRVDEISYDKVLVSPAAGEPGKMPFWHGDRPGRSRAFGVAIGQLARTLASVPEDAAVARLVDENALEPAAARACVAWVQKEVAATGEVPSDRTLVVERFRDEIGDWRVCVLSPFGARVHAPWATAVLARLRAEHGGEADVVWSDDGMAFRLAGTNEPPRTETFLPSSDEVEELVTASLAQSSLFAARFRENAARALLLPRRHPHKRTPLWAQRKRASDLLSVASQYPSFPILLETYRECLRDVFDLPGLVDVLRRTESRKTRVVTVDVERPSPFAASLLFSFVANFIYDGDAPLAERRAQALTIDHAQLRELLGETELRKLLDPEVVAEHERALQRLVHKVKHVDGLHDVLLALGLLSLDDVRARLAEPEHAQAWLAELVRERRAVAVKVLGEPRWAAAEDAGRLRDALGISPPRGLPGAFLDPAADPLGELVARYARTHGPFTVDAIAGHLGLGRATVVEALERLAKTGKILEGAFLTVPSSGPGAREFCDAEVLGALRRKALARLRREIEPVEPAALGRFLPDWQGVGRRRRGPDALLAAVAQLEGCPLPASVLEREILPSRVDGFRPWDLDALCAAGEIVWAGVEPLGPNDGRIALYLADHEALLARAAAPAEGDVPARIRELLAQRGAVFYPEIARALGGFGGEIVDALWDMVWAGEVTNDTLEPLRGWLRSRTSEKRGAHGGSVAERVAARVRARSGRAGPPGTEGRWSLRASRWLEPPTETAKRTALARALLDRYGVVTREVAHAEGILGGFSAVYDVLKAMEEAGRIRRGYYVAGRGATQFALPGADERLRSLRGAAPEADEARTWLLAATDPANPYGAALPWPEAPAEADTAARPQRAAGARVVIHDGALVAYLGRTSESLLTFLPTAEPARSAAERAIAEALGGLVESGERKTLWVAQIDGAPAHTSPLATAFTRAGFQLSGPGLLRKKTLALSPGGPGGGGGDLLS